MDRFFTNGQIHEIGRGGQGIILANDDYPEYVIKESHVMGRCGMWNIEYKTLKDINTKFSGACPEVDVIKVHDFRVDGDKCFMLLDRIYRPDNTIGPAIQAYFGAADIQLLNKARGLYLGLKQLSKYLTESQIIEIVHCLGLTLSYLHYEIKYDATDVEYVLGHKYGETKNKIYMLDFDLVRPIEQYDKNTIMTLTRSLNSESYFPIPDTPYYDVFEKAYLRQAEELGHLNIAEKVIEDY